MFGLGLFGDDSGDAPGLGLTGGGGGGKRLASRDGGLRATLG